MPIEKKFSQILNQIFGNDFPPRIAVGVSGGVDSMALLFLLESFFKQKNTEIFAVTIDHKMRSSSTKEAKFIHSFLNKKNINHRILESYLLKAPSKNIEAELRQMRYNLLFEFCRNNKISHLFVAHHEGDVAENFLIRLFRGSGIDGLAAMKSVTELQDIKIIRPLLDFQKRDLENYLTTNKIPFVHDESNDDENILRNKIRKFLSGLNDAHLINKRISEASRSILESKKLIEEDMLKSAPQFLKFFDLGYFLLDLNKFKNLGAEKALRYLAWVLMDVSGNIYKPRFEDLKNFYEWILQDKNHKAKTFYGCVCEKYDADQLIIYREKAQIKSEILEDNLVWDNRFLLNQKPSDKVEITTLSPTKFNLLAKNSKELSKIKNPLKKVFYTIPVLEKEGKIITIPHLEPNNQIKIKFFPKSKLTK